MKSNINTLFNSLPKTFVFNSGIFTMNMSDVLKSSYETKINENNLFLAHFNTIPNVVQEEKINCKKATSWLADYHKAEIKDLYYNKSWLKNGKHSEYNQIFYFLYDDLIIYFDMEDSTASFLFRKTDISQIESIICWIKKFKERKMRKPRVKLLISSSDGIETKKMEIAKPKLSIDDNYNDDFLAVHQSIMKRLSNKNDKGLVLLHGKPGTGKTSYIRYLISALKKPVIFLPPNMASAITNPDLIGILIDNPNSIFVIEDAENIVVDRENDGRSPVSALLNISDGLLSDCLNIQIICSFNVDISKIDNALMRKGRLIAKYEFRELTADKAQSLSRKLGYNSFIQRPMTLTEIYNQDEKSYIQLKNGKSIGFKAIVTN